MAGWQEVPLAIHSVAKRLTLSQLISQKLFSISNSSCQRV